MFWWTLLLLVVDMALMAGILYVLAGRRPSFMQAAVGGLPSGDGGMSAPSELIERLKSELSSARKVKGELKSKIHSLDAYEQQLRGREKELKELIMNTKTGVKSNLNENRKKQADLYRAAIRMAGEGRTVDEMVKTLGILRGEAELISSLKSFNS